jgi:hypothetical protein
MSEINTQTSIDDGIPEVNFSLEVANVVQTPVDDTLTIEGMAADAKATGDAIAAAKAELQEEIDAVDGDVDSVPGNLFPVGAIYVSTSATAPTFGGSTWTWAEIMIPTTWGDLEDGSRSYAAKGSEDTPGTIHFWMRTA